MYQVSLRRTTGARDWAIVSNASDTDPYIFDTAEAAHTHGREALTMSPPQFDRYRVFQLMGEYEVQTQIVPVAA